MYSSNIYLRTCDSVVFEYMRLLVYQWKQLHCQFKAVRLVLESEPVFLSFFFSYARLANMGNKLVRYHFTTN
jgi:hypothetical protein